MRFFKMLRAVFAVLAATVAATATAPAEEASTRWGMESSPGVVNPAVRSPLQTYLSLDGEWDFSTNNAHGYRLEVGDSVWESLGYKFDWSNARKIVVPGPWEAQGVGEPGANRSWDCQWDRVFWDLRNVYNGMALYRKTFDVPADWAGKAIWLKIGGVRSEATIWVNRKRAAFVSNYCATEKFNVAALIKPGETNEIVALVRNDSPSRKGGLSSMHEFGGFYRSVELEATPNVYIDDVWARGEIEGPVAQTRIRVAAADGDGTAFVGRLAVEIRELDGKVAGRRTIDAKGCGDYVVDVPLENGKLWSPEAPNLYVASVVLTDETGAATHGWDERFGIRKFEVRGKKFYLNGKPYFLRGMGDHNQEPLTLGKTPERDKLRARMAIYKAAGFNYARHHTHAPIPEYFETADELGLLLQPELPYYHDVPTEAFAFDPLRDAKELHRAYRRFASFGTYSCGNEGWFGSPTDKILYDWAKANDPDRLFIHQDGGRNMPGNSDFSTGGNDAPDFCVGATNPWAPGKYDYLERPFIAHEYLNLAIKMDPRLEDRFVGARVSPVSVATWREELAARGLDENWGAATLKAAAKLQSYYQKAGLEAARSDFECDGYSFWSITDVSIPVAKNTVAAQGYMTCFGEPRQDGWSPAEFFQFNGPTALLIRWNRERPIFCAGETAKIAISLSHYGWDDLSAGTVAWRIVDGTGKELVGGEFPFEGAATGFAGKLADVELAVPALDKPVAARFEAKIVGTSIVNDWKCWLFPTREKKSLAGFVVSESLFDWFAARFDDVEKYDADAADKTTALIARPDEPCVDAALADGRSIFAISQAAPEPDVALGWWALGTQVGTAFAPSDVWGDFPTAPWLDELWFGLIRKGALDLKETSRFGKMTPLAVGEGRDSYYLYLGRTKIGNSDVLASFALDLTQDAPEAAALLDALLDAARAK